VSCRCDDRRSHADLPAEPRRAVCPRHRAQRRLLPGRARLPGRHGHARGGLHPGPGLDQRPRPGPVRDRRGRRTVGLYHLAWEVDTLAELERLAGRLSEAGALVGASDHGTTKSLYAKDPDGLEFEVAWIVPADLLDDQALAARERIGPLDLAREKDRYGADTKGGIGISVPAS
jgi:catechol 2,3-dioxygenase-like lactoylglutathione lyase family enzyme